jgi:hypothetical protein
MIEGSSTFRAKFFGCACVLTITAAGNVSSRWSVCPGNLSSSSQRALGAQFTTWRNRCVREWASAHGLATQWQVGERDLLLPARPRDPTLEDEAHR